VDWDHRLSASMDDLDDLGVVDALQVDGRDAEVAVAELALDDDKRHAFACELDGVGVTELVGARTAGGRRLGRRSCAGLLVRRRLTSVGRGSGR
jgi:hypothetical protein